MRAGGGSRSGLPVRPEPGSSSGPGRRARPALLWPIVAAAALLAAAPASAQTPTLGDFAWLEGTWAGPGPDGSTAEIDYLAPEAGVLPAIFRLRKDGRVIVLEAVTLVQEEDGLTMYVRHFTPELRPLEEEHAIELRLAGREGDTFLFENARDENPRRSEIRRTGPDRVTVRSELLREDGTVDEIRVEYRRVGAIGPGAGRALSRPLPGLSRSPHGFVRTGYGAVSSRRP